jgi:RNA polymerase sigma-70 factor (ECF subfamily)
MSSRSAKDFPTTSWSLIRRAAKLEAPESRAALASLCRDYWHPLYAYLRRSGWSKEDSEDLVQGFFARLLDGNRLEPLNPARGSFRGFLLVALKNFVATDHEKQRAGKRGGGRPHLSFTLDLREADIVYRQETTVDRTPEETYERRWALNVLAIVLARLRKERDHAGDSAGFQALEAFLPGGLQQDSYESVASKLNTTPGAIKVAVHRLRGRYRELLRAEIAALVDSPSDVDQEVRYLHGVLSR